MKILVAGDTHGNVRSMTTKIARAKDLGANYVIQVGDFGMWQGLEGLEFLDAVNTSAVFHDVKVFALPGNHENFDLWEYHLNNPHNPKTDGFTHIRSHVLIAPKVHNWKWAEKRFFIAGGAVSIDKQMRRPGISWWPQEELSDSELASVLKYGGPQINYLFTHDQSDHTNWGFNLVPDPQSKIHRQKMDKVIAHLKPKKHFAGHMHKRYHWLNSQSHGFYSPDERGAVVTETFGLDCDNEVNSWCLLDTKQDRVYWPEQL